MDVDASMPAAKTYTTSQVALLVGIHKRTLFRWLEDGKIAEPPRNRSNRRIFTDEDLTTIRNFATRLYPPPRRRERVRT